MNLEQKHTNIWLHVILNIHSYMVHNLDHEHTINQHEQ